MSCFYVITLLVIAFYLCIQSSFCAIKQESTISATSQSQIEFIEDKARLGSTPPSCHNRCSQCHPCSAEQVPTTPIRQPGFKGGFIPAKKSEEETTPSVASYTNYKPLEWKCRCGSHFYNP